MLATWIDDDAQGAHGVVRRAATHWDREQGVEYRKTLGDQRFFSLPCQEPVFTPLGHHRPGRVHALGEHEFSRSSLGLVLLVAPQATNTGKCHGGRSLSPEKERGAGQAGAHWERRPGRRNVQSFEKAMEKEPGAESLADLGRKGEPVLN